MNRIPLRAAAVMAVLLAGACGDAPTEPAALIVAEHARVALEVTVPLPSLAGAETMGAAQFRSVLRDLGIWLDAAEARLALQPAGPSGMGALRAEVDAGRKLLEDAARFDGAGRRGAAVAALLGAEAHLIRTTGFAVAERRIVEAAVAEGRCMEQPENTPAGITIERGRRLLAHAREAWAEGDFERALQRAHYAEALFRSECPPARATREVG